MTTNEWIAMAGLVPLVVLLIVLAFMLDRHAN